MQAANAGNAIVAFLNWRRRRPPVVPYTARKYADRQTDYRQRAFLQRRHEESQYWTLFQELCDGNLAIYLDFFSKIVLYNFYVGGGGGLFWVGVLLQYISSIEKKYIFCVAQCIWLMYCSTRPNGRGRTSGF